MYIRVLILLILMVLMALMIIIMLTGRLEKSGSLDITTDYVDDKNYEDYGGR